MKYDSYIDGIRSKYPSLEILKFEAIEHGQNNVIIVINDNFVFRFPRNDLNRRVLNREYQVLSKIGGQLPLNVPEFQFFSIEENLETSFVGYKFIQGEILSKEVFQRKNHRIIGRQLSDFLVKLHSRDILNQVSNDLETLDGYAVWKDMFQRIEGKLYPYMREDLKGSVRDDFQNILRELKQTDCDKRVVHGDFGPTNILIDSKSSRVNGIIDFGAIHIGDPAEDIACMIGPFGYGVDFIKQYFRDYEDIGKMLNRAVLYTKSFALQEALYGIEQNDTGAFDAGMMNYI